MIRVSVNFEEETFILFERSQCSSAVMYSCWRWEKMEMASTLEIMCMSGCAVMGVSCIKMLERVCESTNPCGTQMGKRLFMDGVPLWKV